MRAADLLLHMQAPSEAIDGAVSMLQANKERLAALQALGQAFNLTSDAATPPKGSFVPSSEVIREHQQLLDEKMRPQEAATEFTEFVGP